MLNKCIAAKGTPGETKGNVCIITMENVPTDLKNVLGVPIVRIMKCAIFRQIVRMVPSLTKIYFTFNKQWLQKGPHAQKRESERERKRSKLVFI